ncbi:ORC1-type DNA replication protein [Candidatus Woesearchaeota archaeon]|nr:MAG: ORC1-type DNA replication protein [Candidatus Woesearchaeota archaeon]
MSVTSDITTFFRNYLEQESLFKDKQKLQAQFIPETIRHRDEQVHTIANILAPSLRKERPSNIFIYGKTGTGKTLVSRYTTKKLEAVAKQQNIPLLTIYVNCKLKKVADTDYRLLAELTRELGKNIPPTGLPTDEVYRYFFETLEQKKHNTIIILDEIDQLIRKAGDEIIYNLTRMNAELKNAQIAIIGISNDLTFQNNLDPRVKSSLSEEEILFPPYNAFHLQEILTDRCKEAFHDGVIEEGVIQKCAAYSAREHGDARRALELIRVAGELAEREGAKTITLEHVDKAEDKIERDRIFDAVATQPKQVKTTIYAIFLCEEHTTNETIFTGELYEVYRKLCDHTALRPLTQRRISDILAELDMLGIINAKIISKGRFGRTREITLAIPPTLKDRLKKYLKKEVQG